METSASDTLGTDSTQAQKINPLDQSGISALTLSLRAESSDTIPDYFFHIMDDFGLNPATQSMLLELNSIDERMILSIISQTDTQTNYLRANAYAIIVFIRTMNQRSELWRDFFHDLDIQLRDPNILRINFTDNQAWKSYTLNELFYSTAFSELMLIMETWVSRKAKDGRHCSRAGPINFVGNTVSMFSSIFPKMKSLITSAFMELRSLIPVKQPRAQPMEKILSGSGPQDKFCHTTGRYH